MKIVESYMLEIQRILDKSLIEDIQKCIDLVMLTYEQNGQIFVMGKRRLAPTVRPAPRWLP